MQLRQYLTHACLLLALAAPAAAQPFQELFSDVPRDNWSYSILDQAERAGVDTGYPEGTFRGKRALTRYELAVAVRQVTQNAMRPDIRTPSGEAGALRRSVLRKLNVTGPARVPELPRLIAEFTPELKLLGADADLLRRQVEERLQPEPVPAASKTPRSKEYEKGARLARRQWDQGQTVLYSGGLAPSLLIDEKLGIPLYNAYGCLATPKQLEQASGYNEQVYRLILERGLPPNNRVRWMSDILDPRRVAADPARPHVTLRAGEPAVSLAPTGVTLRLKSARGEQPARLQISEKGAKPMEWDLYHLDPQLPTVTATRGPDGSHLLFLRYHETAGWQGEVFQVVDTALGRPLNRVYIPDPAPPTPSNSQKKD